MSPMEIAYGCEHRGRARAHAKELVMADTTKQRLIDTGLFTEERSNSGDCLVADKTSKNREARLYFDSRGELIDIEVCRRDVNL